MKICTLTIRTISILLMLGILLQTSPIYAQTAQDRKSVSKGSIFYDPTEPCNGINNATTSSTASAPGDVYVLGDSIGVGLTDPSSQPLFKALASSGGWTVSGDTLVGRTLQQGIEIAKTPPETLKSATTILVVLGTNNVNNSSANKADIENMISLLKAANENAPIYWLKVNVTRSDLTQGAAAYNNLLDEAAGIKTISNTATLSSDNVHPSNYIGLANEVALSIKGTGSASISIGGCACSASSTTLTGSDNAEKVFNFFISKGLSAVQVAGIMGNISQESGFDPEIKQGGGRTKDPSVFGTGVGIGKAWGLIQWDAGGRAIEYAKKAGVTGPIYELSTQLDIVWWHMNNESPTSARNMYADYSKITDLDEAVRVYEKKMEGAGRPMMDKRITAAKDYLALYGNSSNTGDSANISVSSGSCSDITGTGENTKYIDGFTVYSQTDPAWKDKPYSTSTIGKSGCGPSAMAMIITALTGNKVTPYEVATYAGSQGMYVEGQGSSWDISKVVAAKWNLKATNIGVNLDAISRTLQAGGLVITAGKGAKPFTSGGHFIVIRGITADGKLKVGDSGHSDTSDKEWDPAQLLASMEGRDGSVYAITK